MCHMKNNPEYVLTIDNMVQKERRRIKRYYQKQKKFKRIENRQVDNFLLCIKRCINNSVIKKKPFWDLKKYKVTCWYYPQEYDFLKCPKYLHLAMELSRNGIIIIGRPYLHKGYIGNNHTCTVKYDAKNKVVYFSHDYIRPKNGYFF